MLAALSGIVISLMAGLVLRPGQQSKSSGKVSFSLPVIETPDEATLPCGHAMAAKTKVGQMQYAACVEGHQWLWTRGRWEKSDFATLPGTGSR